MDVTRIVAIGGTSKDIEEELKEVFGNITVLNNSTYCNVLGYLRMMCSRLQEIAAVIPLDFVNKEQSSAEEQESSKKTA